MSEVVWMTWLRCHQLCGDQDDLFRVEQLLHRSRNKVELWRFRVWEKEWSKKCVGEWQRAWFISYGERMSILLCLSEGKGRYINASKDLGYYPLGHNLMPSK